MSATNCMNTTSTIRYLHKGRYDVSTSDTIEKKIYQSLSVTKLNVFIPQILLIPREKGHGKRAAIIYERI